MSRHSAAARKRVRYVCVSERPTDALPVLEILAGMLRDAVGPAQVDTSAAEELLVKYPEPARRKRRRRAVVAPEPKKAQPVVYFIEAEGQGRVKIGFTAAHPLGRLDGLRTGSAVPLRLLAVIPATSAADEAALHRRFSAHRLFREWFSLDGELAEYVASLPPWESP